MKALLMIDFQNGFIQGYEEMVKKTHNNGDTYEMNDLDINDFIGTVIDWSGVIKNLYLEETEFNI